jgi:hypothetical protein
LTWFEIIKLVAAFAGPIVTAVGFLFLWKQLNNTTQQVKIASDSLKASNEQNKINQDWKRSEFIAAQMKEFYENAAVNKVLQMVDYETRLYDLGMRSNSGKLIQTRAVHDAKAFPKKPSDTSYVSIKAALRIDKHADEFNNEEVQVRDTFDDFLTYVDRLEQFLTAGLFKEEEIVPYLKYNLMLFRGKVDHVDKELLKAFQEYLKVYHFEEANEFLYNRFKSELDEPGELPPGSTSADASPSSGVA